MAFIATYISTTSASELSSYFEEIAEWTSATDIAAHELAIQESYDYINSKLDSVMTVPVAKEPSTGRYHPLVRFAQAMRAVYLVLGRKHGWASERALKALEAYQSSEKEMLEARSQFEYQFSPDELGIGRALGAAANTSTATFQSDRQRDYLGDREHTYTITVTTAGAVGTAVFKWEKEDGVETTGITSSYDWIDLDNGLAVRCIDVTSTALVIANTWTIRCVPTNEQATEAQGALGTIEIRK